MPPVKPYRQVPIAECGEPLTVIPPQDFAFITPHPYVALGAPYGETSPWMLRASVLKALYEAQRELRRRQGWSLMLFDAYRPNTVQKFLVDREFDLQARALGLDPATMSADQRDSILTEKVFRLFAIPSDDPTTPPPHSTGAAIDLTLRDADGQDIDMGSPIDENSARSLPDHFAGSPDAGSMRAHANRLLLRDIMSTAGFVMNPSEWWHFSIGDQLAVWAARATRPNAQACYGRARE